MVLSPGKPGGGPDTSGGPVIKPAAPETMRGTPGGPETIGGPPGNPGRNNRLPRGPCPGKKYYIKQSYYKLNILYICTYVVKFFLY